MAIKNLTAAAVHVRPVKQHLNQMQNSAANAEQKTKGDIKWTVQNVKKEQHNLLQEIQAKKQPKG